LSVATQQKLVERIWARDATVWTGADEDKWLGWLDEPQRMQERVGEITEFAQDARAKFDTFVLLGMGGSSLAPEVLKRTFGKKQLHVLDTTHPAMIRHAEQSLDLARTMFIVSSKSGTTLETSSHYAYFWEQTGEPEQFIVVTDPGSKLEQLARERGMRVFHGEPTIGGRYSALSPFGIVPAALMGIEAERLLTNAERMAEACRSDANPGLQLGLKLGEGWRQGRDKVCIEETDGNFGLWAEQLIAESTGKQGTGVLPVAGEPLGDPQAYGDDRLFIHFRQGTGWDEQDAALDALREAGQPVFTVQLEGGPADIGAIFVEWEVATALVGARLRINPFDQPNVQEAKDRTVAILEGFGRDGKLPAEEPGSLSDVFGHAERRHSYVCLQAFVAPTPERQALLNDLQGHLRDALGCAATAGFGPRYLHSTGQYHKGGPPTGLFVQLLAGEQDDEAIPGRAFGFRTLRDAQALGDAGALRGRGLPLARIPMAACGAAIERALEHIAKTRIST
jgi:glucose-6-phosphate isomerase